MKKIIFLIIIFSVYSVSFSQEIAPPNHIKSIVFKGSNNPDSQFPIIELGESFLLEFDDLNANESDYYYNITHCDYHWNPSNLLKSEYLDGLDDQLITNFTNSYNTLQPYTNYKLSLPNELTSFKLSGNYLLTITDSSGNTIFTRRFIVYNNNVLVAMQIKRSQDLAYFDEKQNVQFSIKDPNAFLQNPQNSVKISILQNYRWDNAKTDISPQYYLGNELVYKYNTDKTSFWAGNEYLYFQNKDIRVPNYGVYRVELEKLYNDYLFTNTSRANLPYTYNPDINGNFLIETNQGNPSDEADYIWIHFSLELNNPKLWNKEIYVYGKFSNNQLTETYQLNYNEQQGKYYGKVLLKQGFYNYKFAIKDSKGSNFNTIGGNFYQTENQYTVIVYYRSPGGIYDQVIGIGNLASTNVTQ